MLVYGVYSFNFGFALQWRSAISSTLLSYKASWQTGITACTVVQAVVKATSQSNGKGQILTPRGSETPDRISMKLGIYNRVAGMTTHANPRGAATTWVVWANTWKNTCCGFLGIPFFYFILQLTPSAHTWSDFDDLYVIRRVSAQGCAFWGSRLYCFPFWGQNPPKTPILGAWIGIFKLNVQNIKICILSKFLHRIPPNFAQSQRPPSTLRGWSQHA